MLCVLGLHQEWDLIANIVEAVVMAVFVAVVVGCDKSELGYQTQHSEQL